MHLKRLRSARAVGFSSRTIWQQAETPVSWKYLQHKSSFLIASLALIAFVAGNMLGKNGWEVFWKSVMGKFDDSLIAYEGTVSPVAEVADFTCWARFGGGSYDHTWRQVPEECRISLPRYAVNSDGEPSDPVYSVGYMGDYQGREGHGSHPGIDIRIPVGTPVRAVMNGVVTAVGNNSGGYGKFVVLRHPNVPDPNNPKALTTLYSAYAHLSAQLVNEGDIVHMGDELGLSGRTGNVSGPHLHFQIDRETSLGGDETPFHPYWPFSGAEARSAGLNFTEAVNIGVNQNQGYDYTIHPLQYTQAAFAPIVIARKANDDVVARVTTGKTTVVAMADPGEQPRTIAVRDNPRTVAVNSLKTRATQARQDRMHRRLAMQRFAPKPVRVSSASSSVPKSNDAVQVAIRHDGVFTPGEWTTVRFTLLDTEGNPTQGAGLHEPLYLRTAFGYAQFDPPVLTSANFSNGEATVRVLPQGMQTVVIDVKPFNILSAPLKYAGR